MNQTPVTTKMTIVEQAIETTYRRFGKTLPSIGGLTLTHLGAAALALLAPVIAGSAADNATAATTAPKPGLQLVKPAWLTDLSIGIKESYDDNVFLGGATSQNQSWPATVRVPDGSVATLKGQSSFITAVSPKVGLNLAPLLGDQKVVQSLSFAYNPDFVTYHQASSESYNIHRLIAGVKIKADAFSASFDNTLSAIDGSKYGVVYPGSLNSAYATGVLRERRDQVQNRTGATLQYDLDKWFIRPTASLINYDLQTAQLAGVTGYQNYADRHDVNGGGDIGYKIAPKIAATLGYRYGNQYQQAYSTNIDAAQFSSSSDYQRVLVGLEGKPLEWLDVKIQGGPDFRAYGDHAPVTDRDLTTYYGEASLAATLSPKDTVVFKYKQYQWVSSTGKVPYFDSLFDLSYKRKLAEGLVFDVGGKFIQSDYTSGLTKLKANNGTTNLRNDGLYVITTGLTYSFNQYASVNVSYTANLARNLQATLPSLTDSSSREYNDNIVSVGATLKF